MVLFSAAALSYWALACWARACSRFWNASGVSFRLGAEGVRVELESARALLEIEFAADAGPDLLPSLAAWLPRPGAWMETLKQVLAFPMYLTAAWLLWVLGKQRGVDAMALLVAGLTVLALALWWFERRRWTGHALHRWLALALAVAALLPVIAVGRLTPPARADITTTEAGAHVAYSAERLAELRASGTPVFVNMTADWCVTCKANERRVLSGATFKSALAEAGATYMVGDWTNVDPAIGAFLESHGAVGVPLYVVYPAGGGDGIVLPALLSDAIVVEALTHAGGAG